jgi:two-component system cell cycle sensor histidine kinase/response regulator CckA
LSLGLGVFCFGLMANAQSTPLVTNISTLRSLKVDEARRPHPVRLQGVVTYYQPALNLMFLQDSTGATFVTPAKTNLPIQPGLQVDLEGVSAPGRYTPIIVSSRLSILGPAQLPAAERAELKDLASGRFDCRWTEIQGVVRSAEITNGYWEIDVGWMGQRGKARVLDFPKENRPALVDAGVRIQGPASTVADQNRKVIGGHLMVPSMAQVVIERSAAADPFAISAVPIQTLVQMAAQNLSEHRIKVEGVVMFKVLGESLILRGGTNDLYVQTRQPIASVRIGDRLEIIGFPAFRENAIILEGGLFRWLGPESLAPSPRPAEMFRRALNGENLPLLTSAEKVRNLSSDQANRGYPVQLRAVVTYSDRDWPMMFVQDATAGIYVDGQDGQNPIPSGRLVEITGFTAAGNFAPVITEPGFQELGQASMPASKRSTLDHLRTGREDSQWVEIEGIVRTMTNEFGHAVFDIATVQGRFRAIVPGLTNQLLPTHLIDAEISLSGACATLVNQRRQSYGVELYVPTFDYLVVKKPALADPFALAVQPIRSLLQFKPQDDPGHRVRIQGTITLRRGEHSLFVQDATGGLYLEAEGALSLKPGDRVEAVGFPSLGEYTPVLEHALLRQLGSGASPEPIPITAIQAVGSSLTNEVYDAELVRISARFLESQQRFDDYLLVMQDGQYIFNAHLEATNSIPPALSLRPGSLVELTGVCSIQVDEYRRPKAFRILLRSPHDVVLLRNPPLWNLKNLGAILGGTVAISLAAVIWVAVLRKQVRSQTALIRQKFEQETALEQRYRELVEDANDIIYTHDLAGNLTACNRAGGKLSGYSPAEAVGMNMAQLIAPDQLERAREMMARKVQEQGVTTYELDIITKNGQRRTLEVSSRSIIEGGKPVGIQGIARDVTERKKGEFQKAAFLTLGQRLSSASKPEAAARIIGEVANSLLGWDACTVDLYSAPENKIYPLLNVDMIEGKRVDVVPVYVGTPPTSHARRILETGPALELRQEPSLEAGEMIPFGDTARPSASLLFAQIRNGPAVIGILSIQSYSLNAYKAEDLETLQSLADLCGGALERIRAEEGLRQSEKKFQQLVEQAADAFFVYTPEGRFIDVNQRACESLGYSRPELLALSLSEVEPDFKVEHLSEHWKQLASRRAITVEGRHRRKDGTTFPVEVRIGMIESGGHLLILALARDITERLNLETQLRHSQKLESVGRLAAGVAHDFNNILTIIEGYTNLLLSDEAFRQDHAEELKQITQATQRAASLTRQLLAFSRRQLMQLASINLNDVLANVSEILQRVIGEHIVLRISGGAGLPSIEADAGMMEQIIMNLAVNARDAMPKGGELTIATEAAEIDENHVKRNAEAAVGRHVCLTVTDTGMGMDAVTLSRIFEPFFTTKEVGKGTGLGLATVYGVVKQHQGWIEVISKPGQGSTFKVFLPGNPDRVADLKPEPAEAHQPLNGRETILLVEDEPALRTLACRILQNYGYKVLTAASGAEALAVWREQMDGVDLLLTDMVMPGGISGRDLSEQMQAENSRLRVVYTTGYSPDAIESNFPLREGINFLAKPYRPNLLAKVVRECLDREPNDLKPR